MIDAYGNPVSLPSAGDIAVNQVTIDEARERLRDQNLLLFRSPFTTIGEIADAWQHPVRMRDDPELWRTQRRAFDAYIEAHNRPREQ